MGHAYTSIVADALARYHRLRGDEVSFVTGTDENSQKNVEAAEKSGQPDVQRFVDQMSAVWQQTFDSLDISNTDFIRTTEARHKAGVEEFWKRVNDAGDIYAGTYEGWYCVGCEAFKTETELEGGNCPLHKKPVSKLQEKNYFFKLSKYREALLEHIEKNPDFIQPESRRNEIKSYIKDFMQDMSISRESMKWGIKVPEDPTQVIYVWFDALINYMTAVGFGTDEKKYKKWWPAEVHLVGKDIIKFHCALWPAMLMSAKLPIPKRVFAHGFFTVNGDKMSKSIGNVVDPLEIAKQYDLDTLRYYLLRDIPFGEDGDFSTERLAARYEGELANELGNLVYRVLSMTERYLNGVVPAPVKGKIEAWDAYEVAMDDLRPHEAITAIWTVVRSANRFVEENEPWNLAKSDLKKLEGVLYTLLETLRHLGWMLAPIMPETSRRILASLGFDNFGNLEYNKAKKWGGLLAGTKITKGEPIFPRK